MEATNQVKVWDAAGIQSLLTSSDVAVERALVAIYNRQTADEQRAEDVKHHNKIGFSACDAKRGSYYAKWIISGKRLTRHHLDRGRHIALKYVRQLLSIANDQREKEED